MELTLEQIRSVTLGALNIRQTEDGFCFDRFSPAQVEAAYRQSAEYGPRTAAPSCVRLDFYTDATSFALTLHKMAPLTERTFYGLDIWVNEMLVHHAGADSFDADTVDTMQLHLDGKENRIRVYLPTLVTATIRSVSLSDGASIRPYRPRRRILMHGDSITQGFDAKYPSGCYANILGRYYDAEIVNQGIAGACFFADVVDHVGDDYDFITVAYGTNDWRKKEGADIEPDTDAFMRRLKETYPNTPVFVILPLWRSDFLSPYRAGDFRQCRALIGRLAAKQGFYVLDDFDMVPHDKRYFYDARLHPNEYGFYFYAQRLTEMINEQLALR